MKKYMDFKEFRKDVEEALESVAEKYGISITAADISYDSTMVNLKLKCERIDIDVQKAKFETDVKYMEHYGFKKEDYKKPFKLGIKNKNYTLIGFKSGNKYDVIARCGDSEYAICHSAVIEALRKNA